MTVLRISGITKRFGATTALDGVDLELRPGEVHALIGENGAGKSTLMNVLAGAVQPDGGEMEMDGAPYAPASPLSARRRGIALIHQELSLCPHLSVADNILLGSEPSRLGRIDFAETRRRAAALLDEFGHADIRPDAIVGRLSLAARQVVEICRALAANARLVLMDEPTSSFQRDDTERVFALVRRLAARGISVVYISHFLEEVREVADRYTVLRDGRSVASGRITSVTNEQLIAQMVGRSISGLFPPRARASRDGAIALSVRDLTAPGIDRVSFDLRSGEIMGIAGLIGSGRTELIRALFGLEAVWSGEIVVGGRAVHMVKAGTARRLAAGLGYLSEDRKGEGLALPLSVADNLTLTRLSAFGNRWGWLDLGQQRERARSWIERLHIRARTRQPVRTLSGGNQQKVALGRLLHQDATILLLDDPTRGIDIASKEQVYGIITAAADAGKAVLMVSSYLPELFGLCDRLAVMRRGRLSEARPVSAWTPESVLAAAIGDEPGARIPSAQER